MRRLGKFGVHANKNAIPSPSWTWGVDTGSDCKGPVVDIKSM